MPELVGRFYQPTVVRNLYRQRPIARTQVLRPILSAMKFRTFEEAIDLVNDAEYGLYARA
ncbi:MAG: aldehyde dehydrogenase family protein [Pseudomonadota bacterium]